MGAEKSLLLSIVLPFYTAIFLYHSSSAVTNDAPLIKAMDNSKKWAINPRKLTQINKHLAEKDLTAVKFEVSRSGHDRVYKGLSHYESFYCDVPTFQFVDNDSIKKMQQILQNDTLLEPLDMVCL